MKDKEIQQIKSMYQHHNYRCFVCGKMADQRAHIIANTKLNRKLYPVDNPLNWLPACGLKCNTKIDVGKNELLKERISLIIESGVLDETEKRSALEAIVKKNIQRKEGKSDRRIFNE